MRPTASQPPAQIAAQFQLVPGVPVGNTPVPSVAIVDQDDARGSLRDRDGAQAGHPRSLCAAAQVLVQQYQRGRAHAPGRGRAKRQQDASEE